MSDTLKWFLTKLGRSCSPRFIHQINATVNYLETGRWFQSRGMDIRRRVANRTTLFDVVGAEIGEKEVTYLEFGVWKGDSVRHWAGLLKHPNSVLHGFDSFEGLPEAWNLASGRQAFSVGGAIPAINASRVRFFKGWFSETLKDYQIPHRDVLFRTLDADIYSFTKTVLDALEPAITLGTFIYFDEFCDRMHELRAFEEFLQRTGAEFRVIAPIEHLHTSYFNGLPRRLRVSGEDISRRVRVSGPCPGRRASSTIFM
jgi:hypothetical protein